MLAVIPASLRRCKGRAVHLELISVIVDEYDPATDFFVERLGLERSAGSPVSTRTNFT